MQKVHYNGVDAASEDEEPTAWPPQPPSLRLFDSALRCPICFDFFDVPKALPCGHSFCHTCIASNLEHQSLNKIQGRPACPSCRADADPGELRPNLSLGQAVGAFQAARAALLHAVRGGSSEASGSGDQMRGGEETATGPAIERAARRSLASGNGNEVKQPLSVRSEISAVGRIGRKRARGRASDGVVLEASVKEEDNVEEEEKEEEVVEMENEEEEEEEEKSDGDAEFLPSRVGRRRRRGRSGLDQMSPHNSNSIAPTERRPPEGKVECPICGRFCDAGDAAQRHVNLCLLMEASGWKGPTTEAEHATHCKPLKKLPKLVFNLLTVKQLCANVSKAGLPTTRDGRPDSRTTAPREVLERRYTELRHEVDRAMGNGERVPMSELVAKVMAAERQLTAANKLSGPPFATMAGPASGRPGAGGPSSHVDSSHAALIKSMKARMPARPRRDVTAEEEEEEEEEQGAQESKEWEEEGVAMETSSATEGEEEEGVPLPPPQTPAAQVVVATPSPLPNLSPKMRRLQATVLGATPEEEAREGGAIAEIVEDSQDEEDDLPLSLTQPSARATAC